jgi:hypothetical protein
MGLELHRDIGIKVLNPNTTRPTYQIVDEALFARFLRRQGWRVNDLPPIRTIRSNPEIHFNQWTDRRFAEDGVLLSDSDPLANRYHIGFDEQRYYTVFDEQLFQAWLDRKGVVRDGDELRHPFITPHALGGRTFPYLDHHPTLSPVGVPVQGGIEQEVWPVARNPGQSEAEISGIEPAVEEPPPSYSEATAQDAEEDMPPGTSVTVNEVGSDEEEEESATAPGTLRSWEDAFGDGYDD